MGIFSSIAGIIGGSSQKKASKAAQAAQLSYLTKALDYTKSTDARTQGQLAPYLAAGEGALGGINDLLGLGGGTDWNAYVQNNPDVAAEWQRIANDGRFGSMGDFGQWHYDTFGAGEGRGIGSVTTDGRAAQQAAIDALKGSPLYTSLYRNGEDALLSSAAATGGLRGGNTQGALYNLGADTLSNVIQQQLSNLGGVVGMGQNAVNSSVNSGANTAGAVSGLLGNMGQVKAGGILTRGGITAGQIGAIGGIGDQIAGAVSGGGSIGSMLKSII